MVSNAVFIAVVAFAVGVAMACVIFDYSKPKPKPEPKSKIYQEFVKLATAKGVKFVTLFSVLVVVVAVMSCLFFSVLKSDANHQQYYNFAIEKEIEKILEDLYVEALKTEGPSHGGDGRFLILGGIKKSGPSPGDGN